MMKEGGAMGVVVSELLGAVLQAILFLLIPSYGG